MSSTSDQVTITCASHHRRLTDGLWNYLLVKTGVDIDLTCGGRSIGAHRLLLDLFLSSDKLQQISSSVRRQLDDDYSVLESLLEFLYTGRLTLARERLDKLLNLAAETEFDLLVDALQVVQLDDNYRRKKRNKNLSELVTDHYPDPMPERVGKSARSRSSSNKNVNQSSTLICEPDIVYAVFQNPRIKEESVTHLELSPTDISTVRPRRRLISSNEIKIRDRYNGAPIFPAELPDQPNYDCNSHDDQIEQPPTEIEIDSSPFELSPTEDSVSRTLLRPSNGIRTRNGHDGAPILTTSLPDQLDDNGCAHDYQFEQPTREETDSIDQFEFLQKLEAATEANHEIERRQRLIEEENGFYNHNGAGGIDFQDEHYKIMPAFETVDDTSSYRHNLECHKCGRCFGRVSELNRHMRIHTRERQHQCTVCPKFFNQFVQLKRHALVHTGERPHRCSVCPKAFLTATDARRHQRIHEADRNEFGEEDFESGTSYHHHRSTAEFEKSSSRGESALRSFLLVPKLETNFERSGYRAPHQPKLRNKYVKRSESDKVLVLDASLTIRGRNRRDHARPHKCSLCSRAFKEASNLKAHFRTHTGEKPYECSECSKAFGKRDDLNRHFLIHTGEKPHKCAVCEKAFSRLSCMKSHLRTHTVEQLSSAS